MLIGAGGLLSFGHAAFLGIGAYAAGIVASHGLGTLSIALPAALVASAIFAFLTGAIAVRTRGGWNREDRRTVPAEVLDDLYTRLGLTADEVGRRLGTSRNTVLRSAHALGVPVRAGGAVPVQGPEEIELVEALYADPMVGEVLTRHGVPRVPPFGPIWQRFPVPHVLTAELATELYSSCGLGLHHIELLTGRPAATVGNLLHAIGVPLRPAGGRSPFMRRWRTTGREAGSMVRSG